MRTWFYSDPHFWHANVIKYCNRPFTSVEEMNEALVRAWNEVVQPDDIVYCLGDFSFAARPVELFSSRLMGQKMLIPGNHDPIHPYNKHQKKMVKRGQPDYWKEFYATNGWKVLDIIEELSVPGHANFVLSHMPYDTVDERYIKYVPKNEGKWLICGHVHQHWRMKGKMINVGVDAWGGKPVSLEAILELVQQYPDGANLPPLTWDQK